MKTISLFTVASSLALLLSPANAQSLPAIAHEGSTITLAYNFHNDSNDEAYSENFTTQLSASSAYSFGRGFGATFTLGYNHEQYEDSFYSERYLLDVNPTYDVGMGKVGVYYTAIRYNDGITENHAAYGFTADLKSGPFGAEAYAGIYEEEGDFIEDTYGLALSYDVTGDMTVYGAYRRDVQNDDFNALTSLGVSYSLASIAGLPISLTGEASIFTDDNTSLGDSEWNQFSIMASYDFGGGAGSIFRGFRAQDYYYD